MKSDIKNLQASVRAQLQNKAKETNRPFSEILQYYGMERFLYRFSRSKYADKFILKGALLFNVWQIPERRTTLDIDFLARFDNQIFAAEIYDEKSDRQMLWKAFLKKGDIKHAPEKLAAIAGEIEEFLNKAINNV